MALDPGFVTVVQKLVVEQGTNPLFDVRRFCSLLADYTAGEYRKERRRLELVLEGGYQKIIADADDVAAAKAAVARRLRDDEGLSAEAAAEMAGLLALALRGDAAAGPALSAQAARGGARFCANCGAALAPGGNFCPSCGAKAQPAGAGTASLVPPAGSAPAGMVRISGGNFPLKRGGIVRMITLSPFYIGKYVVTQKDYLALMGVNPSRLFQGADLPVTDVSWFDAVHYCNARSRKEGLTLAYTVNGEEVIWNRGASGYRLPSEAEWEVAARGGDPAAEAWFYEFAGSNVIDDVAWYEGNSGMRLHDVGTKAANSAGIYDMSGNVWEWCWDWYSDDWPGSADLDMTNPSGAASGSGRVSRGGSWRNDASHCAVASRHSFAPGFRYFYVGFRVVCP